MFPRLSRPAPGLLVLVLLASIAATATGQVMRVIPVVVTVKPVGECSAGEPILVDIVITNHLPATIHFTTFSTNPTHWNGETHNLELVEIGREGSAGSLNQSRPQISVPQEVSGASAHAISPGESITIRTDLRKWQIRDGWTAGRYTAQLRVDRLTVDALISINVASDPVTLVIK